METNHTHTFRARERSRKNALQLEAHGTPSGKRVQTFSKAELAALLGLRVSELGKLARKGVFQRIGVDRYLLDARLLAALPVRQERTLFSGELSVGRRTAMPAAFRSSGAEHLQQDTHHTVNDFYCRHNGFMENSVNIINVPDLQYATLIAGMFLEDGLQYNERVVLLSFEHPNMLLSRFSEAGLHFDYALESEQLIYLYYKPDVTHSISLSVDYRELFGEVVRLGGEGVRRLVLFNIDALINANSEHLVYTSLHQLIYAANHYQVTLLGLFVSSGHVAELIDEGCRAILPGYFAMD